MTVAYALLASLSNALNVTAQHRASIASPPTAKGWRLIRYLFENPLWGFGWIALAAAFLFQALALRDGELSLVQPLLVTELVFALVLRRLWIHQRVRRVTWCRWFSLVRRWPSSWRCPSPKAGTPGRRARPGCRQPPRPPVWRHC